MGLCGNGACWGSVKVGSRSGFGGKGMGWGATRAGDG